MANQQTTFEHSHLTHEEFKRPSINPHPQCAIRRRKPTKAFAGPYAFVGLSKIRPTSAMDGVPIADRRGELKCGVAAIDLARGRVIGCVEFQTAVEEIFDVQVLTGIRFPEVLGLQKDAVQHTFVVPSATLP